MDFHLSNNNLAFILMVINTFIKKYYDKDLDILNKEIIILVMVVKNFFL